MLKITYSSVGQQLYKYFEELVTNSLNSDDYFTNPVLLELSSTRFRKKIVTEYIL